MFVKNQYEIWEIFRQTSPSQILPVPALLCMQILYYNSSIWTFIKNWYSSRLCWIWSNNLFSQLFHTHVIEAATCDRLDNLHSEKKLKWTGMAIPFWVRKYVICFSSKIYLLYWNGIYIFVKYFIFYLGTENLSLQVRNGISILKKNIRLRVY